MLKRKVQKIKNSYQVVIPKHLADTVGIIPGTMMGIEYENNSIILTPVTSTVLQDQDVTEAAATTFRGDHA